MLVRKSAWVFKKPVEATEVRRERNSRQSRGKTRAPGAGNEMVSRLAW